MSINPLQQRILKVFLEFEKVCKQHNLRFYLSAGTLLGAIRHQGFIPWDDDLDVAMPRKDYELLIKNSDKWFSHPYELDCREKNENYPLRFAKIHDVTTTFYSKRSPNYVGGVYIDVFPLDGLPDGKTSQKIHIVKHRLLDKIFYFSYRDPFKYGKRFDSYFFVLLQKVLSSNLIYRKMKNISTRYDFETSNYITDHEFNNFRSIIEKSVLGNSPTMVTFEGHKTYGMADWNNYLTTIYGNYMVPPNPEKRKGHRIAYLNLDLPFSEYKIPSSKNTNFTPTIQHNEI